MVDRIPTRTHRVRKSANSGRTRAILSLGIVLGLGAVSTMASWSDSATVAGGSFTTGTLDIKVGDPAIDNNPPKFKTDFTMANMIPGNSKDAVLKIRNNGTVPFTYAANATATNNGVGSDQLGSALILTAYGTNSAGACTGPPISTPTTLATSATFSLTRPALQSNQTEDLCFRATLPATASTALQGKNSVITLNITANQTP